MNHTQIAYFLAVARYHSFSEASRQLFVAQSAISKQILSLETRLGMKLFERTNRTITLTPAGEVLYRELQRYDDWLGNIVRMAKQADSGEAGALNIGILHGLDLSSAEMGNFHVFSLEYPDIQLNIKRITFQDMIQELEIGTLDMFITFSFLVTNISNVESCVLKSEKDFLAISKSHSLGRMEKLTPEELQKYTLVTISPDISRLAYANSLNFLKKADVSPAKIKHVNTIEDIMLAVETGLGYGVASHSTRLHNLESILFMDIYQEDIPPQITNIVLVWHKSSRNPAIAKYIHFITGVKGKQRRNESVIDEITG